MRCRVCGNPSRRFSINTVSAFCFFFGFVYSRIGGRIDDYIRVIGGNFPMQ